MTLANFRSLEQSQQFRIYREGIFVGGYLDECTMRKCRQVEDFYIEYIIDMSDQSRMYLIAHRNVDHLDKYFVHLPSISVEDLLMS